ncbi:hypothetical protein DFH06DRAFT_1316750 [Mycena polygramma]|nr:hypothetical protein DFH06DRAFT_1316750 [Mycena polygramma]
MAGQTAVSYNKAAGAAAAAEAAPAPKRKRISSQRTLSLADATEGDDPSKPKKNTVAFALTRIAEERADCEAVSADIVRRVNDARSSAESAKVAIKTLSQKLKKHESELAALRAEVREMRAERQTEAQNCYDTGSESGESDAVPVASSASKRKAPSPPPAAGASKRQRQEAGLEDAPAGKSKMSLQDRISHPNAPHPVPAHPAPTHSRDHRSGALPPPANAGNPRPMPTQSDRGGPSNHAGPSSGGAGPSSTAWTEHRAPPPRRQDGRGDSGPSRGGWGGGNRGRGGQKKSRGASHGGDMHHGNPLPPPAYPPATTQQSRRAELEIGPIEWGQASYNTLLRFCDTIDEAGFGPVPEPTWVDRPDVRNFVIASFPSQSAATQFADAWNGWCRDTQYQHTSANFLD